MSSSCFKNGRNIETTDMNKYVLNSGLKDVVKVRNIQHYVMQHTNSGLFFQTYQPAWFYFHNCFGQIYGQVLVGSPNDKAFKYERVVLSDEIEGDMLIDVLPREGYNKADDIAEKVIIGLHGVTGTSRDGYLLDLAFEGSNRGYNMVAFNHFAPPGSKNLRLMDLCENKHVDEVIQFAKQRFDKESKECEIYLVGFSLGGNHLLRYVGNARKQKIFDIEPEQKVKDQSQYVKAVVSINPPFDVVATCIRLKKTHFGIYDKFIASGMKKAFLDTRFFDQDSKIPKSVALTAPLCVIELDDRTRAKAWGYASGNHLHRNVSCNTFLSYIDKPCMIMSTKDDPICTYSDVPHVDILSNKHCLLVENERGAHCDSFSVVTDAADGTVKYRRIFGDVILKYLDKVSEYNQIQELKNANIKQERQY